MLAFNLMMFAIVAVCLVAIHIGIRREEKKEYEAMLCESDRVDEERLARLGGKRQY